MVFRFGVNNWGFILKISVGIDIYSLGSIGNIEHYDYGFF